MLDVNLINIRDYASDAYGSVDDYPYGGGSGMIMKVEPIVKALESISEKQEIYLLSPRGEKLKQKTLKKLSGLNNITLICGRYKGVDERVRDYIDKEISIGDYILSGGEIPSMVIIEGIARLLPGAVGSRSSIKNDSFEENILGAPQYTRPRNFRGKEVPPVLLSGNHEEIERWRKKESFRITRKYREDLLEKVNDIENKE